MKRSNLLKALGPGILFASTAIGVSHLVQSTKAGAGWGFGLLWAVIIANLFKYPFFEFGSRYASATGTSIIDGYRRLGKWVIWLYFLITLGSMFFVCAAVGKVTSGFMENLFGVADQGWSLSMAAMIFAVCGAILIRGKYSVLDSLMKIIGVVLLISTLAAFIVVLVNGPVPKSESFVPADPMGVAALGFLIPLMGWMPTAVDLSAWNSLWTVARMKQTGYRPKLKETLFDFNFGYLSSALLSLCFITLGAYMLYGTGEELEKDSGVFAGQVVSMYTDNIPGTYWIIAPAAFSIMFGTCITVFDGYARAIERTSEILFFGEKEKEAAKSSREYIVALIILIAGTFLLIWKFEDDKEGFGVLVNVATSISFVIAPIVAIFNLVLVREKYVGKEFAPKLWLRVLAYLGIIFLVVFSILFIFEDPITKWITGT